MPGLIFNYCAETRRWQCWGAGLVGVGETREEAQANWLADYRRMQAQR
jgi:hypothetical protein